LGFGSVLPEDAQVVVNDLYFAPIGIAHEKPFREWRVLNWASLHDTQRSRLAQNAFEPNAIYIER
jgi:hypothetical protein